MSKPFNLQIQKFCVKNRCSLEGEQASLIYDTSDQRDEESPFYSASFYPGQKVAGPSRAFKEAKWLSGMKPVIHNQAQIKGTVEEASIIACDVDWQVCGACQNNCQGDDCLKPPDPTVTQEQLHRLLVVNHFRHASLQIGDKAFYTLKARDLRLATSGGNFLSKQQTSDNDNTEALDELNKDARTISASDSQIEGCSVHDQETSKRGNAELGSDAKDAVSDSQDKTSTGASANLSSGGSSGSFYSAESESKKSSSSTSTASLCDTNLPAPTETSSIKKDPCACQAGETGPAQSETNQVDTHEDQPHTAGSDSAEADADADEDSDGLEVVIPKVKGANLMGALKHDSGLLHGARYPTKRRKKRLRRKRKAAPPLQVKVGDKVCVEVSNTCTTVDVVWQDGSKEDKVLSTDLIPVFHLDELEFFPGDYVSNKRESEDSSKYGVVLTADHQSRLCFIKWFSRDGEELSVERDVSVYDITEHADFVFSAGDVVVRMARDDFENEAGDQNSDTPLSCIGQVTRVDEEGNVSIRWVDSTVSKVKPQELYKVDTEDDGQLSSDGSTVASDDGWETTSGESTEDEGPIDIMDHVPRHGSSAGEEENVDREVLQEANNRINEIMSSTNPAFMTFDNVPEEHIHFHTTFQAQNPGRFLSCLRKEMALLMFSLPAGIIVRGYENRVDILRVMITGPVETPYEHGLFVFDVRLPPDYPASPPVFHYLSQCSGRLNPNLYEDGKVCVSLLGTWAGRGSEVWTSKSNVLQVLVSIQGLILCSEPYYNEAGYEKQRGTGQGLENSRLYNEMVLLKLVQSMEKLITKPPSGLEKEILQHFAHHGTRMVRKFKRWIDLFHGESTTLSKCENGDTKDGKPEHVEETVRDVILAEATRAKSVPGCDSEQIFNGHSPEGVLEPNEENELVVKDCVAENGVCVAENGVVNEANDLEDKGASCPDPSSLEGEALKTEHDDTCQGAASWEKIGPDYPLFPLSRGFCLSLQRALESFQNALDKAGLKP